MISQLLSRIDEKDRIIAERDRRIAELEALMNNQETAIDALTTPLSLTLSEMLLRNERAQRIGAPLTQEVFASHVSAVLYVCYALLIILMKEFEVKYGNL